MDEQGLIHVKYVPGEYQNSIELVERMETQNFSEDEIRSQISKSKENLLDDLKKTKDQLIENKVNQSLWTVEKLLSEHLEILPGKILFLSKEIINAIKFYKFEKEFDKLNEQTERLDQIGKQILEILMKCKFEDLKQIQENENRN